MRLTDDELDDLIRGANPMRTPVSAEPTADDWSRMHRIMDAAPHRRSLRERLADAARTLTGGRTASRSKRIGFEIAWAVPVVAAVVAGALAIAPLSAQPAYAATPPALVIAPMAQSLSEILSSSIDTLRAAPARPATRDAEVVRWALREDGATDPVIVPAWQRWVWNDDGTGSLVATTGAPYSVTADGRIVEPATEAPAEGTPIEFRQPERFGYFADAPPEDVMGFTAYLRAQASLSADADALAIWGAISALRDVWSLSPSQQASALELLQASGGLGVLGAVTDRFGRDGIALQIASVDRPSFSATIVLDAASREIIAADVIYLGGTRRLNVPANSVIQYSAWLRH